METDTKDDGHDDGHPPCSQACFGTWQGLSYWNSPASPPAPVFPLPVPAVPFRWLYLPVLWWLLYTPTPQKPAASCSGFAGREKLSARNVEQHQSTEMEHIAMWEALGPSPWTEALALPFFFFYFFLCVWPSCELVSWVLAICSDRGNCCPSYQLSLRSRSKVLT